MMRCSPTAPSRTGRPHRRLRSLLAQELPAALPLGASTFRPRASANFVGARHVFPGAAATDPRNAMLADLQAQLSAQEWILLSHIVADVSVERGTRMSAFTFEILTVEA